MRGDSTRLLLPRGSQIASASGYEYGREIAIRRKRRSGRVYARSPIAERNDVIYISRRNRFHDRYWKDTARRGENRATWPAGTSETGGNSDPVLANVRCSKYIRLDKRNAARVYSGTPKKPMEMAE
ncbi:PREDICTED: uncharacterized protein LOC106750058 [Dinoponera quadriceps]|uniref:Uncharacterized protein LOC106750058 n=1 Tax=Dinoponera quadriceps TaxID=609295 RepID=A0A6P3Y448_DINQU|nr:PREDICTED: uncharacterized protein LOC106750058 [Dinoponera quadriceps]